MKKDPRIFNECLSISSHKEIIETAILKIKKANPQWVSFFQLVIQENLVTGLPISMIVGREFARLRKDVPFLPSETRTSRFIKIYAETHFGITCK